MLTKILQNPNYKIKILQKSKLNLLQKPKLNNTNNFFSKKK